ncbi:MAG TPA: hypothetical protein VJK90_16660 [Acetobacteraceae bacterium]|nr:hypothetical protein [Acetobacteraceae bacterium]
MRGLLLAATAAASIAGFAAGCLLTQAGAQPAPPPVAGDPPPPGGPAGPGGWRMGPHPGGPGWRRNAMMHRARTFALMYHVDDRQLTAPEVQKIAEAFLLWNGNRTWKVVEVAAGPDGKVGFAFGTADGSVIARFTMDSKTGRVTRTG